MLKLKKKSWQVQVGIASTLICLVQCGGARQQADTQSIAAPEISMSDEEQASGPIDITAVQVSGVPELPDAMPEEGPPEEGDEEETEALVITARKAGKVPPIQSSSTSRIQGKSSKIHTPPTPKAAQIKAQRADVSRAKVGGRGELDSLLDGVSGISVSTKRRSGGGGPPSSMPRPSAPSPSASPMGGEMTISSGASLSSPGTREPTRRHGDVSAAQQQNQSLRVLTAATVPDVDRRREYLSYLSRHHNESAVLGLDMSRRSRFRIVDGQNRPVHDATLTLLGDGIQASGRTHADGIWDFFPSISAPQASGPITMYIQAGSTTLQAVIPLQSSGDSRDVVIRLPQVRATAPEALDLAFLIDVTGSMEDELRYINEEVIGIVDRVRTAVPNSRIRVAATFYRDRGDRVPIAQIPFSRNVPNFTAQMRLVVASGGGDYPEDMNSGLAAALTTLEWSQTPAVRALVIIADAPPQRYGDFNFTYREAMWNASERGIRLLPVAASGANRVVEYLFRALGAFTSTPYVYLTDDSGIGNTHMEADTDRIAVEMFSDLLTRLLISDLQGQGMHEPTFVEEVIPGLQGAGG